jgi:hypothetical protein
MFRPFQVGDRVKLLIWCSDGKPGNVYTLGHIGDDTELYALTGKGSGCSCQYKWRLVSKVEDNTKQNWMVLDKDKKLWTTR